MGPGNACEKKGDWEAALTHYQAARLIRERQGGLCEIQEPMGGAVGLAQALWNIGVLYETLERKPEAIETLSRAVELERRLGRPMRSGTLPICKVYWRRMPLSAGNIFRNVKEGVSAKSGRVGAERPPSLILRDFF